jgi:hypothetical protein
MFIFSSPRSSPPTSPAIAYRYIAPSALYAYGSRPALELQTLYGHCHLPPILHILLADIALPIPMPKYFNVVHSLCLYVYISKRIGFRSFQSAFAYILYFFNSYRGRTILSCVERMTNAPSKLAVMLLLISRGTGPLR